jgi:hypothetical protein
LDASRSPVNDLQQVMHAPKLAGGIAPRCG